MYSSRSATAIQSTEMNMVNVMNMVYDDFYSVLTAQASEQTNARIAQQLEQTDALPATYRYGLYH